MRLENGMVSSGIACNFGGDPELCTECDTPLDDCQCLRCEDCENLLEDCCCDCCVDCGEIEHQCSCFEGDLRRIQQAADEANAATYGAAQAASDLADALDAANRRILDDFDRVLGIL